MLEAELVDLESSIKHVPGVLGCVILTDPEGVVTEIQAFTQLGVDPDAVKAQILHQVTRRGLDADVPPVLVFELDAEAQLGDRETLERAAALAEQDATERGASDADLGSEVDPGAAFTAVPPGPAGRRPPLQKVVLTSSAWTSQARVALGGGDDEVVGEASGEKTPHGLRVLAEATLQAVGQIVAAEFRLTGASLVTVFGREAVMVLVEEGGVEMVGSALVRNGPMTEAAVRATLDAINRRVELLSRGEK